MRGRVPERRQCRRTSVGRLVPERVPNGVLGRSIESLRPRRHTKEAGFSYGVLSFVETKNEGQSGHAVFINPSTTTQAYSGIECGGENDLHEGCPFLKEERCTKNARREYMRSRVWDCQGARCDESGGTDSCERRLWITEGESVALPQLSTITEAPPRFRPGYAPFLPKISISVIVLKKRPLCIPCG